MKVFTASTNECKVFRIKSANVMTKSVSKHFLHRCIPGALFHSKLWDLRKLGAEARVDKD